MTDLRVRIAAVLGKELHGDSDYCDLCLGVAEALIRELNLAKACQSGCVWQIPNRIEDMTPQQRKLLERSDDA